MQIPPRPFLPLENITNYFQNTPYSFYQGTRVLTTTIAGIIGGAVIGKAIPIGLDFLSQNSYLSGTVGDAVKILTPSITFQEALPLKLAGLGGLLLFTFAFYKERYLRPRVEIRDRIVANSTNQENSPNQTNEVAHYKKFQIKGQEILNPLIMDKNVEDLLSPSTSNSRVVPSFSTMLTQSKEEIKPVKKQVLEDPFGLIGANVRTGLKELKIKQEKFSHRNASEAELKYLAYKKQIKEHKLLIKSHRKKSLSCSKELNQSKLNNLIKQLHEKKQLNPKRLEAINIIYNALISTHQNTAQNLKDEISSAVFALKKDNAQKIDLKDKGFFVISKEAIGNPKVIGIAMRTDLIAEGSFGKVFNLTFLHSESASISPKVMKIAKVHENVEETEEAKLELKNEGIILKKLGGKKGIQAKNDVIFEGGYITDKMKGSAAKIQFKLYSNKEKMNMTQSVLSGRKTMKEKKTYHGDIKPDNMLFNDHGKISLVLSDFGGARPFKSFLKKYSLPEGAGDLLATCTPAFVSEKLYIELERKLEAATEKNYFSRPTQTERLKTIRSFNKKAKKLLEKIDDFALGLSLYSLWTDEDPPLKIFQNIGACCSLDSNEMAAIKKQLINFDADNEAIKIIENLLEGGVEETWVSQEKVEEILQSEKVFKELNRIYM